MDEIDQKSWGILVGETLFAVKFVLDYIKFEFDEPDGPSLTVAMPPTASSGPIVKIGDDEYKWDSPRYRDMLCECLGATITQVLMDANREFCVEFDNGFSIYLPLVFRDDGDERGVIFDTGYRLSVW